MDHITAAMQATQAVLAEPPTSSPDATTRPLTDPFLLHWASKLNLPKSFDPSSDKEPSGLFDISSEALIAPNPNTSACPTLVSIPLELQFRIFHYVFLPDSLKRVMVCLVTNPHYLGRRPYPLTPSNIVLLRTCRTRRYNAASYLMREAELVVETGTRWNTHTLPIGKSLYHSTTIRDLRRLHLPLLRTPGTKEGPEIHPTAWIPHCCKLRVLRVELVAAVCPAHVEDFKALLDLPCLREVVLEDWDPEHAEEARKDPSSSARQQPRHWKEVPKWFAWFGDGFRARGKDVNVRIEAVGHQRPTIGGGRRAGFWTEIDWSWVCPWD